MYQAGGVERAKLMTANQSLIPRWGSDQSNLKQELWLTQKKKAKTTHLEDALLNTLLLRSSKKIFNAGNRQDKGG